jgi:hypothetical protein
MNRQWKVRVHRSPNWTPEKEAAIRNSLCEIIAAHILRTKSENQNEHAKRNKLP